MRADQYVGKVLAAHPNAGFFRKLVSLREEDRFASQDLARLGDRDPIVALRIREAYRQVPSHPGAAFTIRDAIKLSGYRVVHAYALASAFSHALHAPEDADRYGNFWRRTMAVATLSGLLAISRRTHLGTAFAGGLIADMGCLLLDRYGPDAGREYCTKELAPELGLAVAEAWALPDELLDVFASPSLDDRKPGLAGLVAEARGHAERLGYLTCVSSCVCAHHADGSGSPDELGRHGTAEGLGLVVNSLLACAGINGGRG